MWKVVRSELIYLNTRFNVVWLMPAAYLVLLGFMLLSEYNLDHTYNTRLKLIWLCNMTIISVFAIKQIELVHYEITEKRVKQQALLPLPRWQTGFTRFLIPTALLVMLFVLYVLLPRLLLESDFFPFTVEALLIFPPALILLTYSLRLLSETPGKVFFIIFTTVYIMTVITLTPMRLPLYTPVFRFFEYALTISGAIQVSTFISIFLWVSFMLRKSYLK